MKKNDSLSVNERRGFLKTIATGATVGLAMMATPAALSAAPFTISNDDNDADAWFNKVKGKHRIVYDVPAPNEGMAFAWSKVFLLTNASTGSPENDCGVVVVLRHEAIPFAMQSNLWEKYKFGEVYKIDDPKTKARSVRNMFWQAKPGDFKIPGIGEVQIGINDLQASGVMVCVCDVALTVNSAVAAMKLNMDGAALKKEWVAGLLPGIQVVPSGVWALGRAQEHGCSYCFAG